MVLDCYDTLYLWEGIRSTKDEKKNTLKFAFDYFENHPDGRASKLADWRERIFFIKQYQEPYEFSRYFFGWDNSKSYNPGMLPAKPMLDQYTYAL